MITRPGGYCPMCDTVYDEPHECGVDKQSESVGITHCGVLMKDFNIIWNAAIEAAAELVGPDKLQAEIRKLKK